MEMENGKYDKRRRRSLKLEHITYTVEAAGVELS